MTSITLTDGRQEDGGSIADGGASTQLGWGRRTDTTHSDVHAVIVVVAAHGLQKTDNILSSKRYVDQAYENLDP